jgi:hypothetical protein
MGFEEVALVCFAYCLCGFGEAVDVSVVNLGVKFCEIGKLWNYGLNGR